MAPIPHKRHPSLLPPEETMTQELMSFEELFDLALLYDLVDPADEDILETNDLLDLLEELHSF